MSTDYLLGQIVEHAGEGIIVYGKDLRYQVWSRRMEEFMGAPAERVLGRMPLEVFPFLEGTGIIKMLEGLLAGNEPKTITVNFKDTNSRFKGWVTDTTTPLRDEGGEIIGLIGVVRDITGSKETEEALFESEALFRSVFENSRDAIGVAHEGRLVMANDRLLKLFGYDAADELVGKDNLLLHPEAVRDELRGNIRNRLEGRGAPELYESKGQRKDGSVFELEIAASTYELGGKRYVVASMRDITERKQTEEKLHESEVLLRSVIENSRDAIGLALDGVIIKVNRSQVELFGYDSAEELEGKPTLSLYPERVWEDIRRMREITLDTGTGGLFETIGVRKDGTEFDIEISPSTYVFKGRTYIVAVLRDITKRKRTEEKLQESEARLRSVFENSRDAIGLALDGVIVKANVSQARLFGYDSVEELEGKPTLMLYPERMWEEIRSMRGRALVTKESGLFEVTGKRKDGTEFDMEISSSTYEFKGQTYIVAMMRDISERKRAEEALHASEDRYRTLLDSSPDAITIVGLDWSILDTSAAAAKMHGYESKEGLIGLSALPFISEGDRARAIEGMMRAVRERSVLQNEYMFVKKNGEEFPVDVSARVVFDQGGEPRAAIIIAKDITERKRTESALRESERKYRMLVDAANEGVCAAGEDFKITFVNRRMCEMMGYCEEEIVGRYFEEFLFKDDIEDNRRHLENRKRGVVDKYERRIRRKDGGTLWTILSPAPILDSEGTFKGVFAMITDITERKNAELEREAMQQQLMHSQKMEAIGRMAGGIAHDFNNILAVIIGTSETSLMRMGGDDPAAPKMQRIFNSAVRARDLTMKLLTFARKEKLDIRNIEVDGLIVELSDMLKRSLPKSIRIETVLREPHPHLLIDFNQMLQAMLNLCINAGDAMPEGGLLRIETGEAELDEGFCAGRGIAPGRYCAISITDTGHGMDEDVLARMYEPFFTTKERGKGTGLGLSISLGIVQGHKGVLELESESGRGTKATVYLPVAGGAGVEEEAVEEEEGSIPVATVLLVDDDAEFLETAADMISSEGFRVVKAGGAARAVEVYRERKSEIDIVLLDMLMPDMDGAQVFVEMKKINEDVKAILCSGYSIDEQSKGIKKLGISSYLQKPFQRKELLKVLTTVLAG